MSNYDTDLDIPNMTYTYHWTEGKNVLPINLKCPICGTYTLISETDITKTYDCSNLNCNLRFKFAK